MGQDWKRETGCPEIEMESIDSTLLGLEESRIGV